MVISTHMEAAPSEGGSKAWEQVDHSTLQRIADLFPAPTRGQIFVARFVERAATERSIIPDLEEGDVVVCAKSIARLGEELDLSNDTTQKYVVLFRAIGMLQKRKFMGQIAFILSLGIYHPPRNLEANLDSLLEKSKTKKSRTKFHDLVTSVKQRCLAYGLISQEFTDALQQLHALVQPEKRLTRHKLEQRLTQAQHLVSSLIAQAMTGRLPQAGNRVDSLPSTFPPHPLGTGNMRDGGEEVQRDESTQHAGADRHAEETPAQLRLPGPKLQVDSRQQGHASESTHQARLDGRQEMSIPPNLPAVAAQVDSPKEGQITRSTQVESMGGFEGNIPPPSLPPPPEQVDSDASVLSLNVNVITLISNITSNVKLVAAFCCKALDEPLSKQRIYLNLFRECEHNAQAVTAALLFTLAHKGDGTMRNPASVFVARCRDYHTQGVSDEAAALVKQYGSLTYLQLLDALRKPAPSEQGASLPANTRRPATPASLSSLPQWGTIPRLTSVEHSRSGMSRLEALQVVVRAQGDRRTKLCRIDLERLSDDSYAVLLDNTITAIPRQVYFYSLREWETRTATIKDCFELFGVTPTRRRCLADALKERKTR